MAALPLSACMRSRLKQRNHAGVGRGSGRGCRCGHGGHGRGRASGCGTQGSAGRGSLLRLARTVAPPAPTLGRSATGAGERSVRPARSKCGLLCSATKEVFLTKQRPRPLSVAEEAAGRGLRLEERAQRQPLDGQLLQEQGRGNEEQETDTVSDGRQLLHEAMRRASRG